MKFYRPPASLSRRKRSVAEFGLRCNPKFSGGDIEEVPPDPIPNSEVKLFGADGTATVTLWESRSLPEFFLISLEAVRCMHASRLFLFHRAYLASRTRPRSPRSEPRFLALGFRAAPLGHPPARPLAVPRSWDLLSRRVVRRDSRGCMRPRALLLTCQWRILRHLRARFSVEKRRNCGRSGR